MCDMGRIIPKTSFSRKTIQSFMDSGKQSRLELVNSTIFGLPVVPEVCKYMKGLHHSF